MPTLRSLMGTDFTSVFLNEDEFAEAITFQAPWSGGSRPISALIAERNFEMGSTQLGTDDVEVVTIHVDNDAVTGIEKLAFDMWIEIDSDPETNPQRRRWAFVEQLDGDASWRELKFQRKVPREFVSPTSQMK